MTAENTVSKMENISYPSKEENIIFNDSIANVSASLNFEYNIRFLNIILV